MNDTELINVLQEQRGRVQMTTPVEQVISRGRAVRGRRRLPICAGTVGAAAAVALGVSAALPPSRPAVPVGAKLAAWTVTREANGSIRVTIRELRDPSGLQHELRADGVPASVTFAAHPNHACRGYPTDAGQRGRRHMMKKAATLVQGGRVIIIIHSHGLPSGGGLQIDARFRHHHGAGPLIGGSIGLVQASAACTGG